MLKKGGQVGRRQVSTLDVLNLNSMIYHCVMRIRKTILSEHGPTA